MAEQQTLSPAATSTRQPTFRLQGHKLDEMGGAQVGRIEGRVSKSHAGEWLLARMGRFGHYCLVPA